MATDPTSLPTVQDLQKTKQYMDDIDDFVRSSNDTLVDTDNRTRRTLEGINNDADSVITAIDKAGDDAIRSYNITPAFDFIDGFTIQTRNQAGKDANGDYWIYDGALPFTVTPGVVPTDANYTKVLVSLITDASIYDDRYKGTFASGLTFSESDDVGRGQDGKYYEYIGSDPLPVSVTAGTDPSSLPSDYQLATGLQTDFDTVDEAVNYKKIDKLLGQRVYIAERGVYFDVVLSSSVTSDGLDVIESLVNTLYSFKEQKLSLQVINLNESVSVDSTFTLNSNLSNSSIVVKGVKTLTTSCIDISRDAERLTLAQANFSIGDLVLIEGTIGHENYTPSRFTDLKFVGEVREVDGLDIVLDSKIDFIATGVTVSKIPKIDVKIDGDLHSSNIALTNVRSVSYKGSCFGSVGSGSGQSFISVSSAKEVNIDVTFDNAEAVLCLVNNNISSGEVNLNSFYSGGESVIGGVGASSKVYRANAIQNMTINGNFLNSKNVDSTIYAARNITCNFKSYCGGANFFDVGDLTSNRLESVQFSECDRAFLNGHMVESNDQCAEMLACTESKISGYYANSKTTTSTEGAVVVKGAGSDVTVDATVKGYGSRGVKFELLDGGVGFKTTPNSDIRSDTIEAIGVRAAAAPYDCRCQIRGSFTGVGSAIIDVRENSDGTTVDATVNMANATAGIAMASSDWNVSVHGINTQVNKQLLSIANGATDFNIVSVSGEHDDIYMQYNGDSRNLFEMTHLNGLNGRAEFGGIVQYFVMKGGEVYSNNVPTNGNFSAGDSYKRESWNTPAGDESLFGGTYRRVEEGRIYNGTEWKVKYNLFEIV